MLVQSCSVTLGLCFLIRICGDDIIFNPGCDSEQSPACYKNLRVPPDAAMSPVLFRLTVFEGEATLEVIQHGGQQTIFRAKASPAPVVVSKVLLKHCHSRSFTYYLWMLDPSTAEVSSCNRDFVWPTKSTIFTIWSLT